MAEYKNVARAKLTILTRGDMAIVRISPASDLMQMREIHIPLEELKRMVAEQ